jgi:general secretion pathway protein K
MSAHLSTNVLHKSRGAVLIATLLTITVLTILVTALASQTRLSARLAREQLEELQHEADILTAFSAAEMDLVLERQPPPRIQNNNPEALNGTNLYRFNGLPLETYYKTPTGVEVRIYDHGGKINLSEISLQKLREILAKIIGDKTDPEIENLIAAWYDWTDGDDLTYPGGAESEYYQTLDPPYSPRNGPLESVEEILLIRGFRELFSNINLQAAFTIYGESDLLNLNTATVEALRLLPGLNDDLIAKILQERQEGEIRGNGDVARLVPATTMAELRPWLNSRKITSYYTIFVTLLKPGVRVKEGHAEIVQFIDNNTRPRVLYYNPALSLPLSLASSVSPRS